MEIKNPDFKENKNTELPKWIIVLMQAYDEYMKEQENKLETFDGNSK